MITVSRNNDHSSSFKNGIPFKNADDVLNITLQVDTKALEGLTYNQVLANIILEITNRIVVSPENRTFYPQGFYNIKTDSNTVKEAILSPYNDSICLVMSDDPFEATDESNLKPYHIYIPSGEYMGPED